MTIQPETKRRAVEAMCAKNDQINMNEVLTMTGTHHEADLLIAGQILDAALAVIEADGYVITPPSDGR